MPDMPFRRLRLASALVAACLRRSALRMGVRLPVPVEKPYRMQGQVQLQHGRGLVVDSISMSVSK